MGYITRRKWEALERALKPCPFCQEPVRIHRSDGGDCRYSRECRNGFYIRCLNCCMLFGYEPDRGGIYDVTDVVTMANHWNNGKAKAVTGIRLPDPVSIAEARNMVGLSQAFVASQMSMSRSIYQEYESGRREIPTGVKNRLAKVFGLDPDSIKEVGK
mgnify:FL=1